MCLYPKIRKNPKYLPNKKNAGNPPRVSDYRVMAVPVACGRCMECMKQKAREWQVRLLEDIRHNKNGKFVTLTFSNESISELLKDIAKKENITEWECLERGYEIDNQIAKLAVRRFLERWRKEYGKSVRHWLVTELGHNGTENIHLHGIIWTNESKEAIKKHWRYGGIWSGYNNQDTYVNERTVNYCTKYIYKKDDKHTEYKPKILTSAGMGKGYTNRLDSKINKYKPGDTKETYTTRTGHKVNLPIYWRNKIYSEEEREKLWLEKLDKNERWVGGIKINTSTKEGEELYYKTLQEVRTKAKRMGYQDDRVNWSRKQYEEERRAVMIRKRIE